jgi:type VII secretion protein EccB
VQSRRDHVQAYQFATNRLTSALVTGKPGRGLAPFRRAAIGTIAGVVIALLLTGGSVIYGIIDPASAATSWRQQGAIVLDEQTGTRFVYRNGTLDPTANETSAVLAAGSDATVHDVPHAALAKTPVGPEIGISGAPDMLPATMLTATWAVCATSGTEVNLDLAPARHVTRATTGDLILVATPEGEEFVLFNGSKYQVTEKAALVAFGLGTQQPARAPVGWLAEIPSGPALGVPAIAGLGHPGPAVGGRRAPIGTVFDAAAAGADQFYVLLANGLAPLSRTEATLITASGRVGTVQHVSPAVISAAPASGNRALLGGLPDLLAGRAYQPSGTALCVRQTTPGTGHGTVITDAAAVGGAGVIVPQGTGLIVQPPGPADENDFLITDTGEKYLLADSNAASALGYGGVTAQVMPEQILALLPTGPTLSATGARQPVSQP